MKVKQQDRARKRADYSRAMRDEFNRLSLIHDMTNYYGKMRSKVRHNLIVNHHTLQPPCLGRGGINNYKNGSHHNIHRNDYLDDTINAHLYI